jgi:hypothetical protein
LDHPAKEKSFEIEDTSYGVFETTALLISSSIVKILESSVVILLMSVLEELRKHFQKSSK